MATTVQINPCTPSSSSHRWSCCEEIDTLAARRVTAVALSVLISTVCFAVLPWPLALPISALATFVLLSGAFGSRSTRESTRETHTVEHVHIHHTGPNLTPTIQPIFVSPPSPPFQPHVVFPIHPTVVPQPTPVERVPVGRREDNFPPVFVNPPPAPVHPQVVFPIHPTVVPQPSPPERVPVGHRDANLPPVWGAPVFPAVPPIRIPPTPDTIGGHVPVGHR